MRCMTNTTPMKDVDAAEAEALEWLAGRVRWERLLTELREDTETVVDLDEAA
jgi:hypothetical protein